MSALISTFRNRAVTHVTSTMQTVQVGQFILVVELVVDHLVNEITDSGDTFTGTVDISRQMQTKH